MPKLSPAMLHVLRELAEADHPLVPDHIRGPAGMGVAVINTLQALQRRGLVEQLDEEDSTRLYGSRRWQITVMGLQALL